MSAPLGYQNLFEIDINPAGTASWARIGRGLQSATPNNNEKLDEKSYLDGDGGGNTEVSGFQLAYTFSGDRVPGNAAQDFILSKQLDVGEDRHTDFKVTGADGTVITGDVTICNIVPPGGDAGAPQAFGYDLKFNGKPTKTDPVAATAEPGTIAAGSAIGTTKFTATTPPTGTNKLGYKLSTTALTAKNRAYCQSFTPYTSGANIVATAGQYLSIYQLDQYNHIDYFVCEVLEAGDIKSA